MSSRILFFYPENPLEKNAGNKTRVLSLLHYLKSKDYEVEFVTIDGWGTFWEEKSLEEFKNSGLVNSLYVIKRKPRKKNLVTYFFTYKIFHLIFELRKAGRNSISDPLTWYSRKSFFDYLKSNNKFDYVLISYAYWAELIENCPNLEGAKTIVDTHDFLTAQNKNQKGFQLGKTFEEEIRRLNLFDEIWAISPDEQYVFSQFCSDKTRLVPPLFDNPNLGKGLTNQKNIDLIYVASDNPHNLKAANWFFNQVYPLLSKELNITVIGKIGRHIGEYTNVTKVSFAESLATYYKRSKIAICPMLSGTGVKIKVIEAFSFGLPVVCNTRGIDGIPNKFDNGCLVSDNKKQFAKHIMTLLTNNDAYIRQQKLGLSTFNSFYSKESIYPILDEAFGINQKSI
ncbi:glycosyltransferase [Echinicola shivajiensis]|uniref:glycosyltransferase n=1 Tax=Echinicola shivajiensis TaxID=1035916 RepID=UPI001BFCCCD5|nr:glycosyltransferase [Echinicola shivajiensis]